MSPSEPLPPAQPKKPLNRARRRLLAWLRIPLFFALGYLGLVLVMMSLKDSLIFFPTVYPDGNWQPDGLKFDDAFFESTDGTRLHGWYLPAEQPRAVVLFAHGNAGNLSHRVDVIEALANRLGAAVLIFDYRGYGRSQGTPSEAGVLADARAARRWLADRAGVAEQEIVLMGESLGGGVMVDLAATDGCRGLILENTFSSLSEVAAYHYPWLPVKMLLRSRLDSAAKIGRYQGPLLQVHGDADTIVPLPIAKKLYEAANEPKRLVIIPGGDHNDPRSPQCYRAVDEFLAKLPPNNSAD